MSPRTIHVFLWIVRKAKVYISILRVDRKTVASQMVVLPSTLSPHHEGVMKITTFFSVNNGNLDAIARMSNGT